MMKKHKARCVLGWISWALIVIGGINWGLIGVGIFTNNPNWNVVHTLLGGVGANTPWLVAVIYLLVGAATIWMIFGGCRCRKCRDDGKCAHCGNGVCTCPPKENHTNDTM